MTTVEQAFEKDFPEESKVMNDVNASVLNRIRAETTFNLYRKGWNAATQNQVIRFNERGRVRRLIQEGRDHENE